MAQEGVLDFNQVEPTAKEINDRLAQAWKEGSKEKYASAYEEFVRFLQLPFVTGEHDINHFKLYSATNGAQIGHRKKTPDGEVDEILHKARTAQQIASKLPIEFLQGLLKYMKENTFPKIAYAAAVAQTANMGKSLSESLAEIKGKGANWMDWASSDVVVNYILDYANQGIKTGYEVRNAKGELITTYEQLDAAGEVIITKYPDVTNARTTLAPGERAKGSGISVEQPPTNYAALGFPGFTLPLIVGNASITKLASATPDALEVIRKGILHDIEQYLIKFNDTLPVEVRKEVDFSKSATREAFLAGIMQAVTSRGWEKYANSYRLVGGMDAGADVYENRLESGHINDEDRTRTILELAGDNPMFIDEGISPEKLNEIAGYLISRVASNSGMICTRINATLVHEKDFAKFCEIAEKKFNEYDSKAETLANNPHEESTKQGALINEREYNALVAYLKEASESGATIVGGRRLHKESGGVFVSPVAVIWPKGTEQKYHEIRARGQEIFAPITNIVCVKNLEEAIDVTNLSHNNLSSAVCSNNANIIAKFIDNTHLGSYNINNPKLGSDNSPFGEHIGHYQNVTFLDRLGHSRSVNIKPEHNGPTGGLAQVAHHLAQQHQSPEFSLWVDKTTKRSTLDALGIKLAGGR